MAESNHTNLPDLLAYLQPFADELGRLSPEDRDESVDSSSLEIALRERLQGLTIEEAETEIAAAQELLENWLHDKPEHVAHWIVGFLWLPDLATNLTSPPDPPPRGPQIMFEPPNGWEVTEAPFRLDLKSNEIIGSIMVIQEITFRALPLQLEQTAKIQPPHIEAAVEVFDVSFGQCHGKKYVYRMTTPASYYQVKYILLVPGGFVHIVLWTSTGGHFDESPIESQLHTLMVVERV